MSLTNEAFDALTNDEKRAYLARCCAVRDAEVEALRAALGAEREARAVISCRHLEVADRIDADDTENEDYDSGFQDGLAYAINAIDAARRAPKIGGGE